MDGVDQGPQAGSHLAHRGQRTQIAGGLRNRAFPQAYIPENSDERYGEEQDRDTGWVS